MLTFLQFLIVLFICYNYDMELNQYGKYRLEISKKSGNSISQDMRKKFEKSYIAIMAELSRDQQILLTKDYQDILSKTGGAKVTPTIKNK